jgi:hypothetical protein
VIPEAACLLSTDSLQMDLEDPSERRGLFKGLRIKVKDCFLKSCTVGQKIQKQHFRKEDSMEPPNILGFFLAPKSEHLLPNRIISKGFGMRKKPPFRPTEMGGLEKF